MEYRLRFTQTAIDDLEQLDPSVRKRILTKLDFFLRNKRPLSFASRLTDPVLGEWRFRIGDWRVVVDVVDETFFVLRIRHRREIYR